MAGETMEVSTTKMAWMKGDGQIKSAGSRGGDGRDEDARVGIWRVEIVCRRVGWNDGEFRIHRGKEAGMKFPAGLFEDGLIAGKFDIGARDHGPTDGGARSETGKFVMNGHGAVRAQFKMSRHVRSLSGENGGKIDRGVGLGAVVKFSDPRVPLYAMELVINCEGVVAEIVQAEHAPTTAVLGGIPEVDVA